MVYKRISYKHKNNKVLYYLRNYLRLLIPTSYFHSKLFDKLESINSFDVELIKKRVDYYNKLEEHYNLSSAAKKLSELKLKKGSKTYFFDLYEYSRFFDQKLKGFFLFGDITEVFDEPGFVKSRPLTDNNSNSVILKWNKIRHFTFVNKDKKIFSDKKNMLVSRGKVHNSQPQRIRFLEKYFDHPLCSIGKVNRNELNPKWKVDRMTIDEQLKYKFILCLEGNDVASNLKWVMSSNSLAVLPKPKFETWFMEGLLIPDYHYVLINDDYSNLEERLKYYINNPDKAINIIKHANEYVSQFKHKPSEDIISLLVLEKYFIKTSQLPIKFN